MATKGAAKGSAAGGDDCGMPGLEEKCCSFAKLSGCKDEHQMNSKVAGKMAKDCWSGKYKNVCTYVDASVFPKCKEKGKPHMQITGASMHHFCKCVAEEIVRGKKGSSSEIDDICNDLEALVVGGGPKVKETKISKTGGVDKMTDQAHYTGAHKERFGADGKGKGIDGRVDRHENKGYVGQYKGEGTYDKKH